MCRVSIQLMQNCRRSSLQKITSILYTDGQKDRRTCSWTDGQTGWYLSKNTLCKKKKMLVTSIFSFSHNVFTSLLFQSHEKQGLFGKGLTNIEKIAFENIAETREYDGKERFLLFPQCFLPFHKHILICLSHSFYYLHIFSICIWIQFCSSRSL